MTKKERNSFNKQAKAEDLIRAINNLSASEEHIATLLHKIDSRLENGISESKKKDINKLTTLHTMLEQTTICRRKSMDLLQELFNADSDYWCLVKHLGSVEKQLLEVFQANFEDMKAYDLWKETNKLYNMALSSFINEELTPCASCLGDMLSE